MPQFETTGDDLRHAHRMPGGPPPFRRAAGVEDLKGIRVGGIEAFVERQVRVTEEDGIGLGETPPHPLEPTPDRSGVVDHAYAPGADAEGRHLGQLLSDLGFVDVAVDGDQRRAESGEKPERRGAGEVPRVDDHLALAEQFEALLR